MANTDIVIRIEPEDKELIERLVKALEELNTNLSKQAKAEDLYKLFTASKTESI